MTDGTSGVGSQEKLEDTKGAIGICKSKDRQYNDQQKKDKGQKAIYKT
jgi:hypothetical protein